MHCHVGDTVRYVIDCGQDLQLCELLRTSGKNCHCDEKVALCTNMSQESDASKCVKGVLIVV